jgi:thymidylate kinase
LQIERALARDPRAWIRAKERASMWRANSAMAALELAYRTGASISGRQRLSVTREGVTAALSREGISALVSRTLRSLPRPGVAVVSFSGLDGAGKSTQVRILAQTIEKLGGEVAIEWMPLGHNPSLAPIRAVVKRSLQRVGHLGFSGEIAEPSVVRDEPVLDPGKAFRQQNSLVTEAWTTVVALTTAFHHRRAALSRSIHGGVIIFDRYVLDAAAQMHYFYGDTREFRFQKWLLQVISPKPRCAFFLDVPPGAVLQRKHLQYSRPQLEKQYGHFTSMVESFNVRRLEGERSQEELCEQIAREVLAALAGKGRTPQRVSPR